MIFRLDEDPRLAPDGRYYLAGPMDVPMPFAMRPLVPLLLGKRTGAWITATLVGVVLQSVGMYLLADSLIAAALLLGLPAGARFSVRHPVLVDAVALGTTLTVAATVDGLSLIHI